MASPPRLALAPTNTSYNIHILLLYLVSLQALEILQTFSSLIVILLTRTSSASWTRLIVVRRTSRVSSDKSSTLSKGRVFPFPLPLVSFALDFPLGRPRVGFAVVVVAFWVLVGALHFEGGCLARVVGLVLVSAFPLALLDLNFIRPSSSPSLVVLVLVPLSLTLAPTAACRVLRLGGMGVGGAVDGLELRLGRTDAGVDEGVGIC
jgi:hypothetical protein